MQKSNTVTLIKACMMNCNRCLEHFLVLPQQVDSHESRSFSILTSRSSRPSLDVGDPWASEFLPVLRCSSVAGEACVSFSSKPISRPQIFLFWLLLAASVSRMDANRLVKFVNIPFFIFIFFFFFFACVCLFCLPRLRCQCHPK